MAHRKYVGTFLMAGPSRNDVSRGAAALSPMLPPDTAANGLPACAKGPLVYSLLQTGQSMRPGKHKLPKVTKSGPLL